MRFDDATMYCMKTLLAPLVALLFISVFPVISMAQVSGTQIIINPEQPAGYEPFTAQLVSPSIDLDRATISWYLNDRLALSGVGKKGFTAKAGPVGTEFRIKAVIESATGAITTRDALVRPQEIDVLWRGYAYTPPFFTGRTLAPSSGLVILTAMPNMIDGSGARLDPSTLVYTWSERGVVLGKASGYGKQTIVVENGQIENYPLQLSVRVTSYDGTVVAQKSDIEIPVQKPEIHFYEHMPLEGIQYQQSLPSLDVTKDETVLRAEPYYFSLDDIAKDLLSYTWTLNGIPIDTPAKENEITLRTNGNTGDARLSLHIENDNLPLHILQDVKKDLMVHILR